MSGMPMTMVTVDLECSRCGSFLTFSPHQTSVDKFCIVVQLCPKCKDDLYAEGYGEGLGDATAVNATIQGIPSE